MDRARVALAAVAASAIAFAAAAPAAPDLDRAAARGLELANAFRRGEGLGELARNARLEAAARDFAAFMAKSGELDHLAGGTRPAERTRRQGYEECFVAENIGYQFRSRGFTAEELAATFMEGWKRSPGHRRNLADAAATESGLGFARDPRTGRYYGVQLFGRPASLAIEFSVANESRVAIEYRVGDRKLSLAPRFARTHRECVDGLLEIRGERLPIAAGDAFVVSETLSVARRRP